MKMNELTPVELRDGVWFKRDDLYTSFGLSGAKVRAAEYLIQKGMGKGYRHFTTVGHRRSPQIHIVGTLCSAQGLHFVGHTPEGELPEAFNQFHIIQHRAGYNNVLMARCHTYATEHGYFEIPFGMVDRNTMLLTATQIYNIPEGVKRIVVPVGSGVNLCGLLIGLKQQNTRRIPIIGVVVGRSPIRLLNEYAPWGWQSMVTLKDAGMKYEKAAPTTMCNGIELDPIYEAKCIPFLREGDLMWVVGKRNF